MDNSSLIVANWKMYLPYETVRTYFELYTQNLIELAQTTGTPFVICPSAESLLCAREFLQDTMIMYGAQNCSEHAIGPYTGEVSATSLKQIGCSYCLVGHYERRILFQETDATIKQKIAQLLQEDIIPIVCIGETDQEYKQGHTRQVLKKHITTLLPCYQPQHTILIAYEPGWAIGTGIIPTESELANIIEYIHTEITNAGYKTQILYGGSVDESTIGTIKRVMLLKGYLIGNASTDFKILKNIVSLLYR